MSYQINPWVAHRSFLPKNAEPKVVLSNELLHELLTLEGVAARAWHLFAEKGFHTTAALATELGMPESDVRSLFDDLENAAIIANAELNSRTVAQQVIELAEFREHESSERFASGGYTEPAPGGSNLELEFEMQDWALSHGYLWSAVWELTYRCNESCIHCFNPGASHSASEKAHRKTSLLDKREWLAMLDELKILGVFRLLLTGGEVALHKEFFDILSCARERGFAVTVFTNGTVFNEDDLLRLAGLYPHRVELSIYSPTPEVHDKITRLPRSFEKTARAAQFLVARNVTVAVKMIVMAETIKEVDDFKLLCESWNVEAQCDFNLSAGVDGARDPLLNLLPAPISLIAEAMRPSSPLYVGEPSSPRRFDWKERHSQVVCGAGRTTLSISPEGNISPCNSMPIFSGSVREEGIKQIWENSAYGGASGKLQDLTSPLSRWQKIRGKDFHVCGNFDRCAWCQKCPGMAFLETGDELSPSTTNCRNAAARLVAFKLREEGVKFPDLYSLNLEDLKMRFPENSALWDSSAAVQSKISVSALRDILRERVRATALRKPAARSS
jgi:radical SAM protein with 4Fe4S-binding SPASM domain